LLLEPYLYSSVLVQLQTDGVQHAGIVSSFEFGFNFADYLSLAVRHNVPAVERKFDHCAL
jgi:hypothetical protein